MPKDAAPYVTSLRIPRELADRLQVAHEKIGDLRPSFHTYLLALLKRGLAQQEGGGGDDA